MYSRLFFVLSGLILALGMSLRVYPAVSHRFWEDELFTYRLSTVYSTIWQQLLTPADDRPPLYYMFTRALITLNDSEFFLRLPSLVASLLSLVILYGLFVRTHPTMAYFALLLPAFSLFFIDLSWQFRDYGLLLACTSVVIVALWRLIQELTGQKKGTKYTLFLLGIGSLAGAMINYLYLAFLASVGICLVFCLFGRLRMRTLMALICTLGLPFLVSGIYLLRQTGIIIKTTTWIPAPDFFSYAALVGHAAGLTDYMHHSVNPNLYKEQQYVYIFLFVITMITLLALSSWRKRLSHLYLFSLLGIGVFIINVAGIAVISGVLHTNLFLPRTFTPAILFFLMGIAGLVSQFIDSFILKEKRLIILAIMTLFVFTTSIHLYSQYYAVGSFIHRQPNRTDEFLQFMELHIKPGDQIAFFPYHYQDIFFPYFWRDRSSDDYATLITALMSGNDSQLREFPAHTMLYIVQDDLIFTPGTQHYSSGYTSRNEELHEKVLGYCGTNKPEEVFKNEDFTVESCEITDTPSAFR